MQSLQNIYHPLAKVQITVPVPVSLCPLHKQSSLKQLSCCGAEGGTVLHIMCMYVHMHTHTYLYILPHGNCSIYDYWVALPWTYGLCQQNRSSEVRHMVGQHHPSTTIVPALSRILATVKNTEVDVCKRLRQMMLKVLLAELAEWARLAWATPAQ